MRPPALQIKAERAAALSTWLSDHWAGTDGPELSDLRDQCKQLSTVVESVAFSVHQSMPDLAEFFFGLPRVNRNVLEYLGQVQLLKFSSSPPRRPSHPLPRAFSLPPQATFADDSPCSTNFALPLICLSTRWCTGVCLVKLDLMTRKGSDDPVKGVPAALSLFAETLAPHIMRPLTWTGNPTRPINPRVRAASTASGH